MTTPNIIGLAGLRFAGKDTVANILIRQGYTNVKMAGGLKAMIDAYLEYVGVHTPDARLEYIEGARKEVDTDIFAGKSPRYAMQTLGTEWGRDLIDTHFWVNTFKARASQFGLVVCTDVRFPNEVDAIHEMGGTVYRIERGTASTDRFSLHESERLILDLHVDDVIPNNGTLEDLAETVFEILGVRA